MHVSYSLAVFSTGSRSSRDARVLFSGTYTNILYLSPLKLLRLSTDYCRSSEEHVKYPPQLI